MIGSGEIKGQLLDHESHPALHVKVNILRLGADGKPVYNGFEEAQTNSEGRYEFKRLPSGEFQIGVNLSSAPDVETPYPSTSWAADGRSTVHLDAGSTNGWRPFTVPPAAAVRQASVQVVWPDGRAAKGVDVWLKWATSLGSQRKRTPMEGLV